MCIPLCVLAVESEGPNSKTPRVRPLISTFMVSDCAACQTLVMEARQLDDFWSFSGGVVVGGSGIARKLNGSPILLVPMWPGLSAGFWRLLLSTMLDVLDARLSRVLKKNKKKNPKRYH